MHIELDYNGKTYCTKRSSDGPAAEEASEMFYKTFSNMDVMKLHLEDGSCMLIGKGVLQNCVIRFVEYHENSL